MLYRFVLNSEHYKNQPILAKILFLYPEVELSNDTLHKKWSFPLRISSVCEEILNGKLHFLCSGNYLAIMSQVQRGFHRQIFATSQLYFANLATLLRNFIFWESRLLCSFELILLATSQIAKPLFFWRFKGV